MFETLLKNIVPKLSGISESKHMGVMENNKKIFLYFNTPKYFHKIMPLFYSAAIFFNCAFYESWPFKMIKCHQRQKINLGKKVGFGCLELKQAHLSQNGSGSSLDSDWDSNWDPSVPRFVHCHLGTLTFQFLVFQLLKL